MLILSPEFLWGFAGEDLLPPTSTLAPYWMYPGLKFPPFLFICEHTCFFIFSRNLLTSPSDIDTKDTQLEDKPVTVKLFPIFIFLGSF